MSTVPPPNLPDGIDLDPGTELGGSARSRVSRHRVNHAPAQWGASVVVKTFLAPTIGTSADAGADTDPHTEGFLRERAGLRYLPGTPALLAEDAPSTTLVMEDIGTAPTLADLLVGDDPGAAWAACLRWARALGAHVVADPDVLQRFRTDLGPAEDTNRRLLAAMPGAGLDAMADWGVRHAEAARAEVSDALTELLADSTRQVISAGDTCPDNAVLTEPAVRFLDTEGTAVHPVAIDAAYALQPFSSCWCVFTPPSGLREAMLAEFTAGASGQLPPLATDPHWPAQVRAAVVVFTVVSAAWLLPSARTKVASIGPAGALAPNHRQLLVSRWRQVIAEAADDFPDTAAAADESITRALREWGRGGALDLPGYPAWR